MSRDQGESPQLPLLNELPQKPGVDGRRMALHFTVLFITRGEEEEKKSPEKESVIMKSNNSNKTSKHKGALLYTFEWKEGVERNHGLVKEIAQL